MRSCRQRKPPGPKARGFCVSLLEGHAGSINGNGVAGSSNTAAAFLDRVVVSINGERASGALKHLKGDGLAVVADQQGILDGSTGRSDVGGTGFHKAVAMLPGSGDILTALGGAGDQGIVGLTDRTIGSARIHRQGDGEGGELHTILGRDSVEQATAQGTVGQTGAGTSDIAVCRDGSVVGYTMATVAGDEITEALMRACLVDFPTAEAMKLELGRSKSVSFTDILGLEQTLPAEELFSLLDGPIQALADEIAQRICQVNGGPPSAVFLAGGGSKLPTLCARVAAALGIDSKRAALAGGYFQSSAYSDTFALSDPEYTTPLGIAVSAGLGLISDSYQVLLNGSPAKLFRSGSLTVLELLMMNGYRYSDLIGRSGKNLLLRIDGRRNVFYGSPAIPAQLAINGAEAAPSALIHAGDRIHFTPAQPGKDCVMTAAELCTKLRCKAVQREGRLLEGHTVLQSGDCLERMDAPPAPSPLPAREAPAQASVPPQRHVFLNGQPLTLSPKPDGSPYRLLDLLERSGLDFQHLDRPVLTQINGVDSPFQQLLAEGDKIEIRYQP